MSEYQITYWRDIPSMVTARDGRRNVAKAELPPRFQVAIDEAAMRLKLTGTDAYMEEWQRGDWLERDGVPAEIARAVVAELEGVFSTARMREILDSYGAPASSNGNGVTSSAQASHPLLQWLAAGRIVRFDGAMGTMLQSAGLTDGGAPELWNVTRSEQIRSIYEAYAQAGVNVITTNTFGGTSGRLKLHNMQSRVVELNRAGALLAREVADRYGALVAGDIGPSGELIEPVGPLSMADATAMFAEQVQGLVEGKVDFILIETMSHLNEVEAAVAGVRQVAPQLPIAATMSFDTNFHTMMGVSPRQAVETMAGWGVEVIGANCGNGPAEIETVMTQMAQYRPEGIYLMAQSNAGMPRYTAGKISYDAVPDVMAESALRLRNLGVNVIGACCGSTPAHVAAIHAALDAAQDQPIAGPPPLAQAEGIESAESRAARAAARRAERHAR